MKNRTIALNPTSSKILANIMILGNFAPIIMSILGLIFSVRSSYLSIPWFSYLVFILTLKTTMMTLEKNNVQDYIDIRRRLNVLH